MLFLNRIQAVCRAHEVHRSERWAVRCSEVTSSHSSSIRVTRPRPHRKQAEKVVRGAFSHYKYKKWHLKWICNFNLYSIQFQFYLYSAKTIILSRGALQSPDPLSASTMSRKNSLLVRKEPYAEPRNIRGGGDPLEVGQEEIGRGWGEGCVAEGGGKQQVLCTACT